MSHKFVLKQNHQVQEVAFEGDDTKYYEFVDANMAPCHRMYMAMQYYRELKCRVDRDYLIAHTQAQRDSKTRQRELLIMKDGKFDSFALIEEIKKSEELDLQMQERLQWILEPESILKYASVIIFDETEDPYDYNMKYNQEVKIAKWKGLGLSSFFLSQPVKRLFPALDLSKEDLDIYLKTQKEVNLVHLQDIFTTLSKDNLTPNSLSIVESHSQRIQVLKASND